VCLNRDADRSVSFQLHLNDWQIKRSQRFTVTGLYMNAPPRGRLDPGGVTSSEGGASVHSVRRMAG
jgi:hypothetical protein